MSVCFRYKKNFKKIYLALVVLGFYLNLNGIQEKKDFLIDKPIFVEEQDLYQQELEKKERIKFVKGDIEATLGGQIKVEHYFYDNLTLLNHDIPEEIGVFKQTIDITLNMIYGQKKYGHKAFEAFLDLRSKNKWGVVGAYRNTSLTEIKLGDVSLGEHDHKSSRPIPWFKDAWLKFTFNSILDLKTKNLHSLKIGWFPFDLGRGLALGPSYATVYEALGLYNYYEDSSAPGIRLKGEIVKDALKYDLYYAKFEDKSACYGDTFNTLKKNHVGRKYNPWSGVAKDDELWAARLRWKVFETEKHGHLCVEPYIFYDEASDQRVEFDKDTKTEFGSYGFRACYKKGPFEIEGEVAFNYGDENLYQIDRNQIIMKTYDNNNNIPAANYIINDGRSGMYQAYSHVVYVTDPTKNAPVNQYTKAAAEANQLRDPALPYPDVGHREDHLKNKTDRIRPAYKNDLDGWMAVIDASYKLEDWNLILAAEGGYISGDYDPHSSTREHNKSFKGFVGLHEIYNGRIVKSALLAGEREMLIPLSLEPNKLERDDYYASATAALTDKKYIGFGAIWAPKKLNINPNLIFFWKEADSYKYILDTVNPDNSHTSATEKARKYIGTEFNVIASYEIMTDLTVSGIFSLFFPGSFYKDVKGVPLKNDYYRKQLGLSGVAPAGIDVSKYRISNDTAMFTDVAVVYKF